ncbi:MAG: cobalamin-binding protein [Armatimonadota bacterium]|nr:cobalamin-binding protein [Armatimonadota bacterium]
MQRGGSTRFVLSSEGVWLRAALVGILTLLCVCVCFAGFPLRVRDARRELVVIRRKPQRIVSLAPSNTEILYALGLGGRVVGVTKYCNYPPSAAKKPKVGDVQINTEAVVALKPDLVLAHAVLNGSVIPRLEKLGLTVFAVNPRTLAEVARDIRTIGRITARPQTAERVASKFEAAVRRISASCAKRPRRKVLVVIQSNPLWVAGPKTFVDEMIRLVHATNVAFDARPGFVTFSKELAISRNPDVIIAGVKPDADYFLKSKEWQGTNAVKHRRVYVIKSDLMTRAGPRLADGLAELAEKLNY